MSSTVMSEIVDRMKRDKKNFGVSDVRYTDMAFQRSSGIPTINFKTIEGSELLPLSVEAFSAACAFANPKLTPELMGEIKSDDVAELLINYFLSGESGNVQLVTGTNRDTKEKVVVSLIPSGIAVLPDLDIYDSILEMEEISGQNLESFTEVPTGHIMRFVTNKQENVRPKVGDIMQAGFEIFNSPRGLSPCTVSSYLRRLSCLNGATRTETRLSARFMSKDPNEIISTIKDGVSAALGKFDEDIENIRELIQQEVTDPSAMLISIGRNFGIPKKDIEGAISHLSDEPDITNSMWGVTNAITRWANNASRPWDSRYKLQQVAYNIIDLGVDRCGSCGSVHLGEHNHSAPENN